ncbi:hypothetical protein NBRC116593_07990 [Sulfitobacter pacificus]
MLRADALGMTPFLRGTHATGIGLCRGGKSKGQNGEYKYRAKTHGVLLGTVGTYVNCDRRTSIPWAEQVSLNETGAEARFGVFQETKRPTVQILFKD